LVPDALVKSRIVVIGVLTKKTLVVSYAVNPNPGGLAASTRTTAKTRASHNPSPRQKLEIGFIPG